MIRRQPAAKTREKIICMEVATPGFSIKLTLRCNGNKAKTIKKYMVDNFGSNSPLSEEWTGIYRAIGRIFHDNTVQQNSTAADILSTILYAHFPQEMRDHIYEITTDY